MKILSYNVNGIRSALSKGLADFLRDSGADVVCLQETKAQSHQVEGHLIEAAGYPYQYWFSAEKKGYSGVAIFSKVKPDEVDYGFADPAHDVEGRWIRASFGSLSVASVYIPSGSSGDHRQSYKMEWLDFFQKFVNRTREKHPNLVICGDYNICHQAIDIHDPVGNKNSSGFLPEERAWMQQFINSGFIDSFRTLHPEPHQYSWWTFRANARNNNKGWRIDYCMVTNNLQEKIIASGLEPGAKHSDHCPSWVTLKV